MEVQLCSIVCMDVQHWTIDFMEVQRCTIDCMDVQLYTID